MILLSFYNTIEFYVIMAVVAAAVVALAAKPQTRGAVKEFLLASRLSEGEGDDVGADGSQPTLQFECLPTGEVRLTRGGLRDITLDGAVSLAVKSDGVNVTMEERIVYSNPSAPPAREAVFTLDFLPEGRYHIRYNSDPTGLFCAFSLHVRPGIRARRTLNQ